jgi:hypothetical protein
MTDRKLDPFGRPIIEGDTGPVLTPEQARQRMLQVAAENALDKAEDAAENEEFEKAAGVVQE